MRRRVILDAVLIIGAITAPPWLTIAIALVGLFTFEKFYEIVAVGFIIDGLYGMKTPLLFVPLFYTIVSGCLLIASVFLRKHLRFYL